MSTIPASELVQVTPSVIGAGGTAVDVIGLLLTSSTRPPVGSILTFSSAADVSTYFGAASLEAALGAVYFAGFNGKNKIPASILFAQYNAAAVSAYLRGAAYGLTLVQLQAVSGTLAVVVDGFSFSAGALNLSAATSPSSAAAIIQTALNGGAPAGASFTGVISTTTLTTSAVTGTIAAGQTVAGVGVAAGTVIQSQIGGTPGGAGTYAVNNSQSVGSEAMTSAATPVVVSYDSVSAAFVVTSGITGAVSTIAFATGTTAATLKLTSATGAVTSQGAAAATPAAFMNAIIAQTTNFVTFMTTFDPDPSGNTNKQAFAAWKNTALGGNRFAYVCWDLDASPTTSVPAAASLGQILLANSDSGTCLLDGDAASGWNATAGATLAAFVCGAAGSIDSEQNNGRITFAYKAQDGLAATVTTQTVADNLGGNPQTSSRGNGYNFYGVYATALIWLQRGFVTGAYLWLDSYINQVWLNSSFKAAMLNLLQNSKSVPYSTAGYALIENSLAATIQAGLNFGAFGPGSISATQIAEVNAQAGSDVSGPLQTQGWYLQVLDASSSARAARTTPPATFWYLDRGSVQSINLASVAVQ
jgi:hypothetical protein